MKGLPLQRMQERRAAYERERHAKLLRMRKAGWTHPPVDLQKETPVHRNIFTRKPGLSVPVPAIPEKPGLLPRLITWIKHRLRM